jgi:hypothetical protein
MSHAYIYKVANAPMERRGDSLARRYQVDRPELGRLRRTRMRDTHQVNQRIAARHLIAVGRGIQRVADYRFAPPRKTSFRTKPGEPTHTMSARAELAAEPATHVSRGARDEYRSHSPRIRKSRVAWMTAGY